MSMRAWSDGPDAGAGPLELLDAAPETALDTVVIGRQSIRDRESVVLGYALITAPMEIPVGRDGDGDGDRADDTEDDERDDEDDPSAGEDAEWLSASASTTANGRIDLLVGDRTLFHRADREFVLSRAPVSAPPSRIVIEIGEDLNDDAEVVVGCGALAARGFTVALGGFPWAAPTKELLDLADIVKIDTRGRSAEELGGLCEQLRGPGRRVLAEHVETPAQLTTMRAAGFDLFQGYALAHLPSGPHRDLGASQAGLARMSGLLLSHPRDFDEIEDMLRTEPGLAYQVMELASIGRMGETARRVNSLRRALVLIGSWRIQTWMAMLLANPHGQKTNGAMTGALARARACELLARPLGRSEASLGYTGGMISAFEELAQVPRSELQQSLALADDLRDAAFGDETDLGRLVSDVADRQEGRADLRRLSDRPVAEIEAALAAGYGWAARASAAIA